MAATRRDRALTRAGLTDALRGSLGLPHPMAARLVAGTLESVEAALLEDGRVQVTGFGTFEVVTRGPRPARNPRTGEVVPLPTRRVVRFRAARALKALLREEKP